jgi:hypothetical protein
MLDGIRARGPSRVNHLSKCDVNAGKQGFPDRSGSVDDLP